MYHLVLQEPRQNSVLSLASINDPNYLLEILHYEWKGLEDLVKSLLLPASVSFSSTMSMPFRSISVKIFRTQGSPLRECRSIWSSPVDEYALENCNYLGNSIHTMKPGSSEENQRGTFPRMSMTLLSLFLPPPQTRLLACAYAL